jgi:hypothetical protein
VIKFGIFLPKLKGQCHEIFSTGFFRESSSLKPLIIALGLLRIFSKIRGDICKSRCTTGINDTGGQFSTNTASVVDTGGNTILRSLSVREAVVHLAAV